MDASANSYAYVRGLAPSALFVSTAVRAHSASVIAAARALPCEPPHAPAG
ncbi:hypothetical protein [Streptomyces peucetius]|uniref:Uncharacterized protein n=1 Tax=Streptomyces peucetius TaxID=1950 RepID=A0ABY6I9J3_STRPE|nr:hypothetical protein [Streptomyces peucetius]UYQ63665.1 hypothetical protein OGH68_20855 [Streptomyces peucetius]